MSDYISRGAAIEKIREAGCTDCGGSSGTICGFCDFENAARLVNGLPTADVEPVRHWIPCSERMPEEIVPVNVVWVNHFPPPYYNEFKNVPQKGTALYYDGDWYWFSSICEDMLAEYGRNEQDLVDEYIEITHWMPLPEPPKEE